MLENILFRVFGSSCNRDIITDSIMECCFKILYWWGVAIVREFLRILKEIFVEMIKENQHFFFTLCDNLKMVLLREYDGNTNMFI
jgi:hypothetical protein